MSYPIAGSIAWSALPRPLYCSMEKENEGKDGAEPRRQSATGNLKSCANTGATGGLDERGGRDDGAERVAGGERGWSVGWWVVGRKCTRKKATQTKLRSSEQFVFE